MAEYQFLPVEAITDLQDTSIMQYIEWIEGGNKNVYVVENEKRYT